MKLSSVSTFSAQRLDPAPDVEGVLAGARPIAYLDDPLTGFDEHVDFAPIGGAE